MFSEAYEDMGKAKTEEDARRSNRNLSMPSGGIAMTPTPAPTARQLIQAQIETLHRRAYLLQALLDSLPARLPNEADAALRELVEQAR